MKKIFTKTEFNLTTVYIMILFSFIAAIGFYLSFNIKKNLSVAADAIDFSKQWHSEDSNNITFNPLTIDNEHFNTKSPTIIYKKLDSNVKPGYSLCFRAHNTHITGYIEDKEIFSTTFKKDLFSCNSTGSMWYFYQIKEEDIGKNVELHIKPFYNDSSCSLSNMTITDDYKFILEYMLSQAFPLFSCMFMFAFAIIFTIYGVYLKHYRQDNNTVFLYLGYFSALLAIWSVLETQVLELFIDASQLLQFINNAIIYLLILPGILSISTIFRIKNQRALNILCIFSQISFVIALLLHFTNIADLHISLPLCHGTIGICIASLVLIVIKEKRENKTNLETAASWFKNVQNNIFSNPKTMVVRIVGISLISIAIVTDIIYFYLGHSSANGSYLRFAIICLIVYCAYLSLDYFLQIHSELEHTSFVKQLAYHDGLTGANNRTAFQERIDYLQNNLEENPRIGIVMIDLNGLKFVNDNYGHNEGDQFILSVVDILKKTFTESCELYRIGGDEFAIIIVAPNPEAIFKISSLQLKNNIQNHNNFFRKNYSVSLASGVAFYNRNTSTSHNLQDIIDYADKEMYNDKNAAKKAKVIYNNLNAKTLQGFDRNKNESIYPLNTNEIDE
ncbi:MAG: GGDEF domain-containing protein [Lachnospiraceae bacterium]|nr:GGDEF domain-containing protein [Lachnospiraceae bacterium]